MKLELEAHENSTGELNLKRSSKTRQLEETGYDGGFQICRPASVMRVNFSGSGEAANERIANARSSLQGFTCK